MKIFFASLIIVAVALFVYRSSQPKLDRTPSAVVPFGKQNNWLTYNFTHEKILKKQKVRSVKAIFYQEEEDKSLNYLVSIKRSGKADAKKDGRYEFLGGKIDKKERIITALIREVAEEDPSLILAKQLKQVVRKKPGLLRYKLVHLKNGSIHAVFVVPIKPEQWTQLEEFYQSQKSDHETYGFEKLDESYFSLAKGKKKNWTPQTIRIFKALRREAKA